MFYKEKRNISKWFN